MQGRGRGSAAANSSAQEQREACPLPSTPAARSSLQNSVWRAPVPDDEIDYVFTFAVAGRVAVYRKWIMSGFKQSEDTISSILEKVSSNGFDSFLH